LPLLGTSAAPVAHAPHRARSPWTSLRKLVGGLDVAARLGVNPNLPSPGARSDAPPDVVDLLTVGLAYREKQRARNADASTVAIMPDFPTTADQRARAESLLYDFAMRHFSSRVEVIRREAVIEHLGKQARDRSGFLRLFAIGVAATIAGIAGLAALWAALPHLGIDPDLLARLLAKFPHALDRTRV
jgi:hypothetical protein